MVGVGKAGGSGQVSVGAQLCQLAFRLGDKEMVGGLLVVLSRALPGHRREMLL